jgi:hypothetical protein
MVVSIRKIGCRSFDREPSIRRMGLKWGISLSRGGSCVAANYPYVGAEPNNS